MSIDPKALREAFGAFLTGVTVVTAMDTAGAPIGFTANSFTSVSLDPPLLLVCLAKTSRNYATLTAATGFAVNILSSSQKDVSNTFARPVADRFSNVSWRIGPHGAPILSDVAAWFDCSMHQVVDAGDHAILIGRVEAFDNRGSVGLGYARGGYFSPALIDRIVAGGDPSQQVGLVAEYDGRLLLQDDGKGGLGLPRLEIGAHDDLEAALAGWEAATGVSLTGSLLYSVYTDTRTGRQHVVYRVRLGAGADRLGSLYPIGSLPLERVRDAATRDVLKRYESESGIGNFGVYIGDQDTGRVHALATRG